VPLSQIHAVAGFIILGDSLHHADVRVCADMAVIYVVARSGFVEQASG
jgi:hypothetical protein